MRQDFKNIFTNAKHCLTREINSTLNLKHASPRMRGTNDNSSKEIVVCSVKKCRISLEGPEPQLCATPYIRCTKAWCFMILRRVCICSERGTHRSRTKFDPWFRDSPLDIFLYYSLMNFNVVLWGYDLLYLVLECEGQLRCQIEEKKISFIYQRLINAHTQITTFEENRLIKKKQQTKQNNNNNKIHARYVVSTCNLSIMTYDIVMSTYNIKCQHVS